MPSQCNYSAPPPQIDPDNDITGIGVIINYIATAGIAILIILVYYFGVYEPATDPFNRAQPGSSKDFRANPVDDLLLGWLRGIFRRGRDDQRVDIRRKIRREQTFIKCMLTMSDLQLLTGFSALVSGFAQITSEISTFNFTIIVYLAYFSTVTHLSCLTILRQYLYTHRFERGARLLGMAILAIMLIAGLALTSNYPWAAYRGIKIRPDPGDLVICFLSVRPRSDLVIPFVSMLVSVFLISIAFISRVIKSHEVLSRRVFGYWQSWLGRQVRKPFRIVYHWAGIQESSPNSLKRTLVYRPIMTSLCMFWAVLDVWSSVQFEVGWLVVAFFWGVYRLILLLPLAAEAKDPGDDDNSDWSYGQVVSVVLLAAPLVTMIGYLDSDIDYEKRIEPARLAPPLDLRLDLSSTDSLSQPLTLAPPDDYIDDPDYPDHDWAPNRATLGTALAYINLVLLGICGAAFFLSLLRDTLTPLGLVNFTVAGEEPKYIIAGVLAGTGLYGVIVFSLLIETALANHRRAVRMSLQVFSVLYFAASPMVGFVATRTVELNAYTMPVFMQPIAGVVYILCALVYRVRGRPKWG